MLLGCGRNTPAVLRGDGITGWLRGCGQSMGGTGGAARVAEGAELMHGGHGKRDRTGRTAATAGPGEGDERHCGGCTPRHRGTGAQKAQQDGDRIQKALQDLNAWRGGQEYRRHCRTGGHRSPPGRGGTEGFAGWGCTGGIAGLGASGGALQPGGYRRHRGGRGDTETAAAGGVLRCCRREDGRAHKSLRAEGGHKNPCGPGGHRRH